MSTDHPRPWHRGSIFGDGRRRPLNREQRARYRYLLSAHYRAGRLPAKQERVGLALLRRLGADGQLDPSYDTLGADAGCSARTARRATASLRELGLLSWQCRLVRTEWRAEQTSNQYELLMTPGVQNGNGVLHSGGQSVRESQPINFNRLDAAARTNAMRQLLVLGASVPVGWQQEALNK